MNSIVRDCGACLILAVVYTVGFGLALYILFSHVQGQEGPNAANKFDAAGRSEEFQNFPKSLLTLFYAFLGSFEPEVWR